MASSQSTDLETRLEKVLEFLDKAERKAAPKKRVAKNRKALFTSGSDQWYTPPEIKDWIADSGYAIGLDPCTSENNPMSARSILTRDGLTVDWRGLLTEGVVYMNPPYGRSIGAWVDKLLEGDHDFVALVPARTDTAWWARMASSTRMMWLRSGRIHFLDRDGKEGQSAPFPSAIFTRGVHLKEHPLWAPWMIGAGRPASVRHPSE